MSGKGDSSSESLLKQKRLLREWFMAQKRVDVAKLGHYLKCDIRQLLISINREESIALKEHSELTMERLNRHIASLLKLPEIEESTSTSPKRNLPYAKSKAVPRKKEQTVKLTEDAIREAYDLAIDPLRRFPMLEEPDELKRRSRRVILTGMT